MIRQIKEAIRRFVYSRISPPFVPASYSQAGEDAVISFLFCDIGVKEITYLDIGTNKPDFGNNTYKFYKKGNKGVCVEADPSLIQAIKNKRPADKVINAGVSVSNEIDADFFIFNEPSLNTFDKEEAKIRESQGTFYIVKILKVPLLNLNQLLEKEFKECPDLLSIDIEGLDFEVLKTLNVTKYPIPVICTETCTYSETHIRPKDQRIIEYMISVGYMVYADTYINTVFVNKKWFFSKK
jgi:FkbM family methyltransferase